MSTMSPSKRRSRKTDPAENAAVLAFRAVIEHDEQRWELMNTRAAAIAAALEAGSTLERLGELMGVTEARVRQMRDGKAGRTPTDTPDEVE